MGLFNKIGKKKNIPPVKNSGGYAQNSNYNETSGYNELQPVTIDTRSSSPVPLEALSSNQSSINSIIEQSVTPQDKSIKNNQTTRNDRTRRQEAQKSFQENNISISANKKINTKNKHKKKGNNTDNPKKPKNIKKILIILFIILGLSAAGFYVFTLINGDDSYNGLSADDMPAPNFDDEELESPVPQLPLKSAPPLPTLKNKTPLPQTNKTQILEPFATTPPLKISYADQYSPDKFVDLGPISIARSSFWSSEKGKLPHIWLKIKTASSSDLKIMARKFAQIKIKYVLNQDGYNIYNSTSEFETKFFNQLDFINDNGKNTATAIKDIYLHPTVKNNDIIGIAGILTTNTPHKITKTSITPIANNQKTVKNNTIIINKVLGEKIHLSYTGNNKLLIDIKAYNKQGDELKQNLKNITKNNNQSDYTLSYNGAVDKLQFITTDAITKKDYPFIIGTKYEKNNPNFKSNN